MKSGHFTQITYIIEVQRGMRTEHIQVGTTDIDDDDWADNYFENWKIDNKRSYSTAKLVKTINFTSTSILSEAFTPLPPLPKSRKLNIVTATEVIKEVRAKTRKRRKRR